jgi:hypothetical protein
MKNLYRVTVRFNLDNEDERRIADYLRNLKKSENGSLNKFMVKAVESYIHSLENLGGNNFTLEDIRRIFREETQIMGVAVKTPVTYENSADEQADNDASVLAALEMFG